MNTKEFIDYLHSLDLKISLNNDKLRLNAPQGILTDSLKQELRARKPEIIAYLQKTSPIPKPNNTIKIIKREGELPLSFAQLRFWLLDQFEPNSSVYNIPIAVNLQGNLNINALEKTFNQIIARHEVFRSSCEKIDSKPVLRILPTLKFNLSLIDLSKFSPEKRELEVTKIINEDALKPFNLSKAPLFRAKLLQLNNQEWVLIINLHHFIADGWSMKIFFREINLLYNAIINHKSAELPPLPIQYVDFTHWQKEKMQGELFRKQLNYWQKQLQSSNFTLDLPTDKPRPKKQTYNGARKAFILNPNLSNSLKAFCRQEGVTLFMALLTAFKILLYRYSQQSDIIVGTTVSNRQKVEVENLIGTFANNLPLRSQINENLTVKEFLAQVKETTIKAYSHQDLPFEKLVEELNIARDLSRSPIYQVLFILYQKSNQEELNLFDVNCQLISQQKIAARLDLALNFADIPNCLSASLIYNTDLFNSERIERMIDHFQILLAEIINNPQQKIPQLPLLTETEKKQILIDWTNLKADYPNDKCIHQLFEEQVVKKTNKTAVVFEDKQLSYQELNEKANKLAHYLQKLGVKTEILVGICVERYLEMIIGILAILKAGGAYVPLDPNYPIERLKFMLEDAQISILLTQEKLVDFLNIQVEKIVKLDADWELIKKENNENLVDIVKPNNLAYVIYTSGSTGKPKGVMIEHKSLVNFTNNAIKEYQINSSSRVLQFASLSFDTAAEEIYPCLATGATLILRTPEMLSSPFTFWEKCRDLQLTVLDLPTAYWHQLISEVNENFDFIKLIIIGGEQTFPENIQKWQKLAKNNQLLFNSYGPTEGTIVTTIFKYDKFTPVNGKVLIGKPIANTKVYILDNNLQPVPIGIPGEICIGGDGLARGYLNQPELTAEKFIPNPFGEGKLYKTGDLARYLFDGNIEFIGRIDNQVKIRGFRIELGEIEANLNQHANIKETIVIAKGNQQGDKYLTAYLIVNNNQPEIRELRQFLRTKLPEYMIPSAFVFLDKFPLTPNGKIDRKALPEPDLEANRETEFMAPRNETEIKLAQIWQEVLGRENISINDNFFEIGGHSLLAIQLISRIQENFQLELSLYYVFEAPTIKKLSDTIDILLWGKSGLVTANSSDYLTGEI